MKSVTVQDLLKIASQNKEKIKKTSKGSDDVLKFINTLKIKPGNNRVKCPVIFRAYKAWTAKPYAAKSLNFFHRFSQYFTPQDNRYRFYLLNYSPVELMNKVDNMKVRIK